MKTIVIVFAVLGLLSSCSNDDAEIDTLEFAPGEISVGIKSGTDIKYLFGFINQFEHKVIVIRALTFTSRLSSGDLQNVLKVLNEKTYTNDGLNWRVTGYLNHQTNQITIFPKLFNMENIKNQNDWLTSLDEFKLKSEHHKDLNSGIIVFTVPSGEEHKWKSHFKNYAVVDWAELHYFADIKPIMN